MSLDASNFSSPGKQKPDSSTGKIDSSTSEKTSEKITTLLGLPKLEFHSERHISDEFLQECFWLGNMFIKNLDNGYGAIMKYVNFNGQQVEMGTGYTLVAEQYINVRGKKQGIALTEEAKSVGSISYIDELNRESLSQIFFVGPATLENGIRIGITYTNTDMHRALEEILNID